MIVNKKEPTKSLYRFQQDTVDALISDPRKHIVVASMGLGKSICAIAWARQTQTRTGINKVLVLSTRSKVSTTDFQDDADAVFPGWRDTLGAFELCTWDLLYKWVNAHAKELDQWIYIADEVAKMKAGTGSRRGRAFLKIAKTTPNWSGYTGTPGDAWIDYQGYFIACGLVKNKTEFVRNFCNVQTFKGFPEIVGYYHEDVLRKWWGQISYAPDTKAMTAQLPKTSYHLIKFEKPKGYDKVIKLRQKLCKDGEVSTTPELEDIITNSSQLSNYLRQLCFTKQKQQWVADFLEGLGEGCIIFYNYITTGDTLEKIAKKALPETARIWRIDGRHHEIPTPDVFGDRDIILAQWQSGAEGINAQFIRTWLAVEMQYSYALHCYDDKTEILTPSGFVPIRDVSEGDIVEAYNLETHKIERTEVKEKIERDMMPGEKMYHYKSSFAGLDMMMTSGHELLYRNPSYPTNWKKTTLEKLLGVKSTVAIPVAADGETKDFDGITDDELLFVGWFLSDGNKFLDKRSKNVRTRITISQSISNAKEVKEIDALVNRLNLGGNRYIAKKCIGGKEYPPVISWSFSESTKKKGKRGLGKLLDWLDRELPSELYEKLSKRQLLIVLEGYYHGNGVTKRVNYYSVKTKICCMGDREDLANRLQRLCIKNGLSCRISTHDKKPCQWNSSPRTQYLLHYCGKTEKRLNPQSGARRKDINKRYKAPAKWEEIPYAGKVYCIRNDLGTTVVRRNGSVFIAGNCQAKGRINRIGQERPMFYYLLKTKDTIEDAMLKCLQGKQDFALKIWLLGQGLAKEEK